MTSQSLSLFLLLFFLAGCTSSKLNFISNSQEDFSTRRPSGEIEVLFESPEQEHESVGVINWDYYEPGLRRPELSDALPRLREEASTEGGDALVIRQNEPSETNTRSIRIVAEVIRFSEASRQ